MMNRAMKSSRENSCTLSRALQLDTVQGIRLDNDVYQIVRCTARIAIFTVDMLSAPSWRAHAESLSIEIPHGEQVP